MSGESEDHALLVAGLTAAVKERHGSEGNLVLFLDDNATEREHPPRIGGHLPDLYAQNVPRTFVIIGEAKTRLDLISPRSRRQLSAFLRYLALFDSAFFYLAVPVLARPVASSLLREIGCGHHTFETRILTLGTDR